MTDPAPTTSQLAADVLDATRSALVAALNDARPSPDWAWDILNRWDALVARITDLEAQLREAHEAETVFGERAVAAEAQVADLQTQLAGTVENVSFYEAQVAALEARPWFPPPEWQEGWEGIVTAYDYERKYVGCVGRETWDWLLDSGITEAQVAALTQERDEAEALTESTQRTLMQTLRNAEATEAALATTRQALEVIVEMGDYTYKPHEFATIARRALAATGAEQEPATAVYREDDQSDEDEAWEAVS